MADRTMYRGDSPVLPIRVLQSSGAPQDLTGWTLWFTLKRYYSDADNRAVAQLGTQAPLTGLVVTDAPAGMIEVTIPALATVGFADTPTTLLYDLQAKDTLGRIRTVETGTMTVLPDVTRATS